MINLQPTVCNLCGGKVEYISNGEIYGRKYGSGFCYHCKECGAYVGTHKNRPHIALGILADAELRELKKQCHDIFDRQWKSGKIKRKKAYENLAEKLEIPVAECHFGWFDKPMLKKAIEILN